MREFLAESAYFGVALSLTAYFLGAWLKKKLKSSLISPLLVAIIITILALLASGTDYQSYSRGARWLSYLLTPATVCLAIPLYQQLETLKKNALAVLAGILSGVISAMGCVLLMALAFKLTHAEYVTFLPKSVTTAIGMGVSEELGGHVAVTVVVIIVTGVLGGALAEPIFRLFRITRPVARGVALGTAAHAVGTAKATELGEAEGAMAGLSLVVAGLLTVILAPLFAGLF